MTTHTSTTAAVVNNTMFYDAMVVAVGRNRGDDGLVQQLNPFNFWPMSIVSKRSPVSAAAEHLFSNEDSLSSLIDTLKWINTMKCLTDTAFAIMWTRFFYTAVRAHIPASTTQVVRGSWTSYAGCWQNGSLYFTAKP